MDRPLSWILKVAYLNHFNFKNLLKTNNSIFDAIYQKNFWGNPESVSGSGSTLAYTAPIRKILPKLFKKYHIHTILDAPCGDFNWMKEVDMSNIKKYIGVDVVSDLINQNTKKYHSPRISFQQKDITHDPLLQADLIICRDCLFHLSNKNIFNTLLNFKKSKSRYLLTTNHIDCTKNHDIITGGFRLINLSLPPYNLPPPLENIPDRGHFSPGSSQYSRHLCLWQISDIPA